MIKLMVCGSRSITDEQFVFKAIDDYVESLGDDVTIIEGEARGVDSIAKKWGIMHGKEILSFPANWDLYGKSAGFQRNLDMFRECDNCLIIWDGQSKGTKHDIDLCRTYGKPHKVVNIFQNPIDIMDLIC